MDIGCRVQPVEHVLGVWAVPARGVGGMGEADSARCPVDILPAERMCQGWQILVLQAQQDCEVLQAVVKPTWVKPNKKQCPTVLFPVERVRRDENPGPVAK